MADCIFCRIVAGTIPCTKVYEDEACLAFLDIGPVAPCHTLLIPRRHFETIADMPAAEASRLAAALPRLARAVQAAAGAEGINVYQTNGRVAGQEVPHVHFHLIPRRAGDGLGFHWPAAKADFAVLAKQAEAIRAGLGA